MSSFKRFLISNASVWRSRATVQTAESYALIDATQEDAYHLYGIIKAGLILSELYGLKAIAYPSIRSIRGPWMEIITSMCHCKVWVVTRYIFASILNILSILRISLGIRCLTDVLHTRIRGVELGSYLYDYCYVPGQKRVTLKMRIKVAYLLGYFFTDWMLLTQKRIRLAVIGDPAYRCGILFEICKKLNIECIYALDLKLFQMHRYKCPEDYGHHYRHMEKKWLNRLSGNAVAEEALEEYFERRFSGQIAHHDIVRAYTPGKNIYSRSDIQRKYSLDPDRQIIVVMAHALCDAPHAYPGMLYADYEDWLRSTVRALSKNKGIEFLIKEHPSAALYNEEGVVSEMLAEVGCSDKLLESDTHTMTVLMSADCVITCGGTIGMEFAAMGKAVVLAARPPYAGNGFTIEPGCKEKYEALLTTTSYFDPLDPGQLAAARASAYVMFELFDNSDFKPELGDVKYVMGEEYDKESFYASVAKQNETPIEEQVIYGMLKTFYDSGDGSVINLKKLNLVESGSLRYNNTN